MKRPEPAEIEQRLASLPDDQQNDPQVRAEVTFSLLCQLNSGRFSQDEAETAEERFGEWLNSGDAQPDSAARNLQTVFKRTIWWPGLRGDQVLDVFLVKYRLADGRVGAGVVASDVYAFLRLASFELDPFRLLQLYAGWQAAKLAQEADGYVSQDSPAERAKVVKKLSARGLQQIEFDRCFTLNHRTYYDGTCRDAEGRAMVWGGSSIYCGGEQADATIAAVPMSYVILGMELYGEEGIDAPGEEMWGCSRQAFLLAVLMIAGLWHLITH